MKSTLILTCLILLSSHLLAQNTLKEISYSDADQALKGLVTANAGTGKPGVLILPAWMGIDEEAKNAALALEKAGYIAFIADIYGEGNTPSKASEASKIATAYKKDFTSYQKRIALALTALKEAGAQENKLAVIGYCFGGTGALEAARANLPVQGVVSIHGGLAKAERANGPLNPAILILHGADDQSVSVEDIKLLHTEMNDAKADWQMIYYAHAKHTFTNPASADYLPIMAQRAWQHTLLFLSEILKGD